MRFVLKMSIPYNSMKMLKASGQTMSDFVFLIYELLILTDQTIY